MDLGAPLAALIVCACACTPPPDFVTDRGVAFYLSGSTFIGKEEANAQEARFLARLDAASAFPPNEVAVCVAQTEVQVVPEGPFPCATYPGLRCAGEQYGAVLKVAAADCPYTSAFVHELTHWLQQCVDGRTDYGHLDPIWREVAAELAEDGRRCTAARPP
ncbi:MAG: hypothetical protein IRZ16_13410 [Myxococcaceae bacterium]|nr:hypothetical protein [Myxococcaceae bacterium]